MLCDFGIGYDCASWSVGGFYCTCFAPGLICSQCIWLEMMKHHTLKCRQMLKIFPVFMHGSDSLRFHASMVEDHVASQKSPSQNSGAKILQNRLWVDSSREWVDSHSASQGWVDRYVDLSGPEAKQLKGKLTMIRRKSMSESTQSWISSIESTGRSTCSDPRESGSKREWAWVNVEGEWVDSLKLPRIESTGGSTCSGLRVLRWVMSRLIGPKPPKMSFLQYYTSFCTFFCL